MTSSGTQETKGWCHCGLGDVIGFHGVLVVCTNQVIRGAVQGCREALDPGNGVTVRDRGVVECAVVTTWTPITRELLKDHLSWGGSVA